MRVAQRGDRVQVRYVKRFKGDPEVPPRGKGHAELTAGVDHRRLPGLAQALVGLAEGESRTLVVPAPQAYGPHDAGRVYRLRPKRFVGFADLCVGKWVRIWDHRHRRRLVRVVALRENMVVVDANHLRAGHSLELEVEVIAVHRPEATPAPDAARDLRESAWADDGGQN